MGTLQIVPNPEGSQPMRQMRETSSLHLDDQKAVGGVADDGLFTGFGSMTLEYDGDI